MFKFSRSFRKQQGELQSPTLRHCRYILYDFNLEIGVANPSRKCSLSPDNGRLSVPCVEERCRLFSFPFRGIIFRECNMREGVPSFTAGKPKILPGKEDLSVCKGRSVWFEVVFA
ncbi:hypothetical protein CDAR_54501 [Caerostris darwini]|uniref:Uncharacterized protein n=1 Tax=Caerostris darwini TaxID=1538125 RepID=A0AAV4T2J2_9ARAC|nr:hypothetical protein CDAR_54501 [Caerostris darwini]